MTPGVSLGVVFHSDNGGASYGGAITIQTPGEAGPIATGLWDSDGDVYFDVVLLGAATPASCTIDAASIPGSWTPYNRVAAQNGLQCTIVQTGSDPTTNTYSYDLQITVSNTADFPMKTVQKQRSGATAGASLSATVPSQEYVFNVVLLDGSPLAVWQPGTLALQVSGSIARGSLSIPGFYKETMALAGTTSQSIGQTGTLVYVSGKTSEMSGDFAFIYSFDGFLTTADFLGGMASILDFGAQETYLYVLQGSTQAIAPVPARMAARKSRL
jgi:hypothetical protein